MRASALKGIYLVGAALLLTSLLLVLALLAFRPNGAGATTPAVTPSPTPTAAPTPSPTPSPTPTPQPLEVAVTEKEFSVAPSPVAVATGNVHISVTNQGVLPHEFVIMQTDNPPNALLYDDSTHKAVEEGAGQVDVGEIGGEDPFLLPGHTESDTFDLAPGRYVLLCNIPDHYKAGMFTAFTVGNVTPATNVPSPSPTPTPAALPRSGGPPAGGDSPWAAALILGIGVLVLLGSLGSAAMTSRRSRP